jgi:hypothetical protein
MVLEEIPFRSVIAFGSAFADQGLGICGEGNC